MQIPKVQNKLPDIQILRALACFMVVSTHCGFNFLEVFFNKGSAARQGVFLFFTISGFVISKSLDDLGILKSQGSSLIERIKENTNLLKAYFIRRMFRIFPVAFLNIGILAFAIWWLRPPTATLISPSTWLEFLLYVCTAGVDILRWNGLGTMDYGYWTLGVEEKAYFLLALLFVFFKNKKQVFQFIFGWILISYFSHVFLFAKQPDAREVYYCSPFIGMAQIFMGCVAYFFYKNVDPVSFLSKRQSIFLLIILLFVSFTIFGLYKNTIYGHVLTLFLSPIIVYLSSRSTGLFPKNILQKLLLKMGDRSYIIYLIHMPLLLILPPISDTIIARLTMLFGSAAPIVTLMTLVFIVGEIIHQLIEKPFIKYGRKISNSFLKSPQGSEPITGNDLNNEQLKLKIV